MFPQSLRPVAFCVLLLLTACVTHRKHVVTIDTTAASLPQQPDGPLAFDDAVRLLVAQNPALRAARARIKAVNVTPGPGDLFATQQVMDGRAAELMVQTDLLALLGLGSRQAEIAWARSVRNQRVREHHELARDLVAKLAEAYAVEQALRTLPSPVVALDIEAFEQAGLASDAVLEAGRALQAEGEAEARIIAARLKDARREVSRLIGAVPTTGIEPTGYEALAPTLASIDRERLVLTRGDLQTLMAAFDAADRRFKFEVERQYPTIVAGLGRNLSSNAPMQMIGIRLPLDAPARAQAAQSERIAAAHVLEDGIVGALQEASHAVLELEAAAARHDAVRARVKATEALLSGQRAHLETNPAGLEGVVLVGGRRVDAARMLREASVAHARAHVRAATMAGWPSPEVIDGEVAR